MFLFVFVSQSVLIFSILLCPCSLSTFFFFSSWNLHHLSLNGFPSINNDFKQNSEITSSKKNLFTNTAVICSIAKILNKDTLIVYQYSFSTSIKLNWNYFINWSEWNYMTPKLLAYQYLWIWAFGQFSELNWTILWLNSFQITFGKTCRPSVMLSYISDIKRFLS